MGIIRFLLAVCVLLWHCPKGILGTYLHPALAVQCFYAISGFLIQMAIWANYQGTIGWQKRFYMSRVLRLYPLYMVFFLVSAGLTGPGNFSYYMAQHEFGLALLWLFNNLLIVGQDALRFFCLDMNTWHFSLLPGSPAERATVLAHVNRGSMTLLGQSWTLALELYFYVLAPFLLLRRSLILVALILLSVAIRFWLGYHGHVNNQWLYGFFPSELAVFLLGALAYRAYLRFFASGRVARLLEHYGCTNGNRALLVLSAAAVATLCVGYRVIHLGFGWGHYDAPPLGVPVGYWVVFFVTVLLLPFAFHLSKNFKPDRFIGELSYPIYISHMTVLALLTDRVPARYVAPVVIIICTLLSIVLVRLVEQPLDRLRHKLFYRRGDLIKA
jgi:peptidoglycan/LPS O-acetylase OafA/YrhL